jgi:signal transduction protein with GAF and PtsI domain
MENDKKVLEEKLQRIVETIDVANALTEPLTKSIENLLKLSADSLKSEDASVIIRDGDEGDMKFLMAIGKVGDQLTGMKIPSGKGVAGFVFSSGQSMAIADVGQEKSFYAEVDKQTGYSTQTILATPLRYKDEVIGVLEYVNRIGEPPFEPFTPFEMDQAALFAEAIASLVNAYELAKLFREFSEKLLHEDEELDSVGLRNWINNLRISYEHREMIDLAVLVRDIAGRGEAERALCREILEAISRYSSNNAKTSYLSY